MSELKKEAPVSITDHDLISFSNLVSVAIRNNADNRKAVSAFMVFEQRFKEAVLTIQKERDDLVKELKKLKKNINNN